MRAGAHFIDFAGRNYMMMRASKLVFINFEFNAYGAIVLMMLQKNGGSVKTGSHTHRQKCRSVRCIFDMCTVYTAHTFTQYQQTALILSQSHQILLTVCAMYRQ